MNGLTLTIALGLLMFLALGGAAFAFAGMSRDKARKRVAAVAKPAGNARLLTKGGGDSNQQRRKNVQQMLKELEEKQAEHKKRPSIRRRIEMAGLDIQVGTFWKLSAGVGVAAMAVTFIYGQALWVVALAGFVAGLGLPRWVLGFLKNRREKAFTREFAGAIDVIVRSVKTGLPVNEALKVVSTEISDPVGSEFRTLIEGLKVGVTMEQGLKRMYERMPTTEVNFFGIVMTIQQKTGGNLSEALQNLSNVLRDRKRLEGKIKAMSSEAKASASIIGSLPPGVMGLVYMSTPDYIRLLFTEELGNLMLIGCVMWMAVGILVMKKMISFKF
jgi:tight adherence protein B